MRKGSRADPYTVLEIMEVGTAFQLDRRAARAWERGLLQRTNPEAENLGQQKGGGSLQGDRVGCPCCLKHCQQMSETVNYTRTFQCPSRA